MCKLVKWVRNCVVFWKNLHSWQKFYTTAGRDGRDGRDKFQVCAHLSMKWQQLRAVTDKAIQWLDPDSRSPDRWKQTHKYTTQHKQTHDHLNFFLYKHFILRFIWWSTFFTGGSAGFEILRWFHFWHRYSNLGSMVPLRSRVMETWYVWKWRDRSSPGSATVGRGGRGCARVTGLGRGEWAAPARWGSPWYWKSPAASRK